jgi:hypothetical protein
MHNVISSAVEYNGVAASPRISWREAILLATYHIRLLNWWLFLLMALGFVGSCGVYWLTAHTGTPVALGRGNELSRFVLESGAGLVASTLTSFLVVGDPMLEVMMTTHTGIYKVLAWRYLLTLVFLLIFSAAYLAWSLWYGTTYTSHQTILFILLTWLAPVLVMSMLGLLGALMTRNAALGAVIAALPLMADLFLHDDLLPIALYRPFFIPFTIWEHDSSDWWLNRFVLLGCGLALALCCWWWLRREERLLGNLR